MYFIVHFTGFRFVRSFSDTSSISAISHLCELICISGTVTVMSHPEMMQEALMPLGDRKAEY